MASTSNLFVALLFTVPRVFSLESKRDERRVFSLDGKWSLVNSNKTVCVSAQVPGCVHTALQQQGLIQDPYYRFNDLSYRWVSLENWTYTKVFTLPPTIRAKQKVTLVLEGVDTVATVWFNGKNLGSTDNMFRRYDFPVSDVLLEEENKMEVSFVSPVVYAAGQRARSAYRIPPECPPEVQKGECHVNFLRKEQSSFSWDWGPSFPTMGLWKGVRVEAFDLLRISHISSVPLYDVQLSQWTVQVHLCVEAVQTTEVQLKISVPELSSQETLATRFLPATTRSTFTLHINTSSQVKLWWPSGHGEQPFYLLTLQVLFEGSLLLSTEPKHIYFRTVELVQDPIAGSPGLSFYFRINGKPIFLKGSNWIPAHAFQDRVSLDVLENLLLSAVDANMNALRVWGGGVYEQDQFYTLCDQLGIMVWQDFMFACAMYPTDKDFVESVREEVVQQVRRLKSHPSIIVWSGNNENEAALATDWFNIPVSERDVYIKDYVSLYVHHIREVVLQDDPSRPFLVSSPTNGLESEQEGWVASNPYDPLYGDTHFYSYTADCWDWTTFPRTRFASEYGFQSWPSFSTLNPVSEAEDWSYDSRFASHRQHHLDGNQQMLHQAALHFHLPNSTDPLRQFRDTLYITQVMQAQCVKAQTEFYRRSRSEIIDGKGHTMGALYWQLNDIWQAPSWASLEFGGKWKMLHHFAQNFFAPVLPVAFEDEEKLFIYAVSDLSDDLWLRAVILVFSWSSQDSVCTQSSGALLVPGGSAVPVYMQRVDALLAGCGNCTRFTCLVTFHLEDSRGQQQGPTNHHFPCSLKDAQQLQRPNITVKVLEVKKEFTLVLHSSSVAPFVWLDVGHVPGRFSANGFLLLSRNRTVTFTPWRPTTVAELSNALTVTSLADVY
ncbi:beta-mannosidase [Synchiropus picturatus]